MNELKAFFLVVMVYCFLIVYWYFPHTSSHKEYAAPPPVSVRQAPTTKSISVSQVPCTRSGGVNQGPAARSAIVSQAPAARSASISKAPAARSTSVSLAPTTGSFGVNQGLAARSASVSQAPAARSASVSQVPAARSASVSQVPAARSANVSQDPVAACPALFTITNVPDDKMFERYLRHLTGSLGNVTESVGWLRPDRSRRAEPHHGQEAEPALAGVIQVMQGGHLATDALAGVRQVLLKRKSLTGVTTQDYNKLGQLLPSLISFGKAEKHNTGKDQQKGVDEEAARDQDEDAAGSQDEDDGGDGRRLRVVKESRLDISGGVLPYVPCVVASYHRPHSLTACLDKRLANNNSLWIHFLGDSKIRNLFTELLNRADEEYRFMVKCLNKTEYWSKVSHHMDMGKKWEDMVATTHLYPRMRLSFSFRTFVSVSREELTSDLELQQLRQWATGKETPPHLLIVGYGAWMLHLGVMRHNNVLLSYLWVVHQVVVPLLQQISQKTRVLVLPQSRLRPHTYSMFYDNRVAFGDANFDWTEMMFLHQLRHYREKHPAPPLSFTSSSSDHQRATESPESRESVSQREVVGRTYRDHLVPWESGGGEGLWWWDTALPLNQAEISECEELYRRGLVTHPVYKSNLLLCFDVHHAGRATLHDLVTMILNLLCNSVIGLSSTFCCS